MIFFVCTRANAHPIRLYLRESGAPITPVFYESLGDPAPGTYVFADLESLTDARREEAARAFERLSERGCRLLNHPTRSLRRYDLLRTLHGNGTNRFNVYRPGEEPRRFPVFLRGEDDHRGSRSPLLRTPAELARRGKRLVVEFCDTKDGRGIYRKYGAFIVGSRIVPRHLFFSRRWMIKDWDLLDEEQREEEERYIETNPHEARLREIFAAARIEYGRIDYALKDGEIQVWEINTNPVILGLGPSARRGPIGFLRMIPRRAAALLTGAPSRPRARVHRRFAELLRPAWDEIADA